MIKRITFSLFAMIAFSTFSFGQFNFGGGATITDGEFGIQAKVLYNLEEIVSQPIDGVVTFSLLFPGNSINAWALDFDGQYRITTLGESIQLSSVSGLQFARVSTDFAGSDSDIGLNLGANFVYPLESLNIYAQPKITIGGFGGFTIAAGVLF